MHSIYTTTQSTGNVIPIIAITTKDWPGFIAQQNDFIRNYAETENFNAQPATVCIVPNAKGLPEQVLLGVESPNDIGPSECYRRNCPELFMLFNT